VASSQRKNSQRCERTLLVSEKTIKRLKLNYQGANLAGAVVDSRKVKQYLNFSNACMDRATFTGRDYGHGEIFNCNFSGATFAGAKVDISFRNCNFSGAIFNGSEFPEGSGLGFGFVRCNLSNVQFSNTTFPKNFRFVDCDLTAAKFENLKTMADFEGCDLRGGSVFAGVSGKFKPEKCNVLGVEFRECDLPHTYDEIGRPKQRQVARAESEIEIRLNEIKSLREQGLINDDEYNATRKKILGL